MIGNRGFEVLGYAMLLLLIHRIQIFVLILWWSFHFAFYVDDAWRTDQ